MFLFQENQEEEQEEGGDAWEEGVGSLV